MTAVATTASTPGTSSGGQVMARQMQQTNAVISVAGRRKTS
jgi:hypothetical protein